MRAEQDNDMRGRNGTMAPDEPSELRYYLGLIRRRLRIILVSALVIVTLGVLWVYRQVPLYRASARILVETEEPRRMMLEEEGRRFSRNVSLENQMELITSRSVLSIAAEQDR
ncbi:MAG: Wzz/FepE/Etk N-terminal domain-containing protein, partial [Planctomycetota bacterium]